MASKEPTTPRAAIYTHFETTEAGNVVCNHCHNLFKSSGGTSNLHKHLIAAHPKVDRRSIFLPEYLYSTDDEEQTSSQTADRQSLTMNESAIKTGEILVKQVARSGIYSHFTHKKVDGEEAYNVTCRHCNHQFRSAGGTSNLHKHMKAVHPSVNRTVPMNSNGGITFPGFSDDEGESFNGQTEIIITTTNSPRKKSKSPKKPQVQVQEKVEIVEDLIEEEDADQEAQEETQDEISICEITIPEHEPTEEQTPRKRKRVTEPEPAAEIPPLRPLPESSLMPNINSGTATDLPTQQVLQLIKQINLDQVELRNQVNSNQAELQNQLLQQQYESQRQLRLIEELQKEIKQLKRPAVPAYSPTSRKVVAGLQRPDFDKMEGMPVFPLYIMSQVDDLEEQIASDPEFKERLSGLFKTGQSDKVDSILSWFSKELLGQFTYKDDKEGLATQRLTTLSEIFQLMYSSWCGDGFSKKDFTVTLKSAFETAAQQLSKENLDRNNEKKRKRKANGQASSSLYFNYSVAQEEQDLQENKIFLRM